MKKKYEMKQQNSKIRVLEGKDIVNAGKNLVKDKMYKGTIDFSLEALKLNEISNGDAFRQEENDQFCDAIINVTFKYKADNMSTSRIREELYSTGFIFNKVKYKRFKRSSGSSRLGKCLFIAEEYYDEMMEWSKIGIEYF